MDKLKINGAIYSLNLGVTEKEREIPQIIIVDIALEFDFSKACKSDLITDTIDYYELNNSLAFFLKGKSFCLIEKVAEEIAQFILNNYDIDSVTIGLKKPSPIVNVNSSEVEITRKNA